MNTSAVRGKAYFPDEELAANKAERKSFLDWAIPRKNTSHPEHGFFKIVHWALMVKEANRRGEKINPEELRAARTVEKWYDIGLSASESQHIIIQLLNDTASASIALNDKHRKAWEKVHDHWHGIR